MSEQAPQPTINPQAQAAFEYEHIYPAEQLKQRGQQQVEQHIYDENRPYQDTEGNAHDPVNGQFANIDAYFDKQREIAEDSSQNPYEAMSMTQLARKLGEAEFHNDKTSAINIGDVLMDKLSEYESKVVDGHDASQKTGERHDTGHNNTFSDNMWDRVMGVKDKEIASLKEQNQARTEANQTEKSDVKPDKTSEAMPAVDADSKEAIDQDPTHRILSYRPNEEGMSDMATVFTEKGYETDLTQLTDVDDETLIISTKGTDEFGPTTYFVESGQVYNLTEIRLQNKDEGGWDVSKDEGEHTIVTIGEGIMVDGKLISGPVDRILCEQPAEHESDRVDDWRDTGVESPFQDARELIDRIENADEETAETSLIAPSIEDGGYLNMEERMRARPKKIMGWAAKQLKRLKNAPLAAGTHVSNKLHNTSERFSKQEKGRRRTIIGATAGAILLAGAAYLDLKGHGTGNTQELVNSPKGTIPNPLEGVNLASATDKHQVIRDIADVTPRGGHGAAVVDHVKTVTVHGNSGDTLWNEATQKLHRQGIVNPTNKQINVATLRLEHLNGISPEQAHFLASEGDEVIKV